MPHQSISSLFPFLPQLVLLEESKYYMADYHQPPPPFYMLFLHNSYPSLARNATSFINILKLTLLKYQHCSEYWSFVSKWTELSRLKILSPSLHLTSDLGKQQVRLSGHYIIQFLKVTIRINAGWNPSQALKAMF